MATEASKQSSCGSWEGGEHICIYIYTYVYMHTFSFLYLSILIYAIMSHPVYHRAPKQSDPRAETLLTEVPAFKRSPAGEGPNIELGPSGTNQLILKFEELIEFLLYLKAALLVIF